MKRNDVLDNEYYNIMLSMAEDDCEDEIVRYLNKALDGKVELAEKMASHRFICITVGGLSRKVCK